MHKQIIVNLPVADMAKSQAFFKALGYSFNPDFTGDQGAGAGARREPVRDADGARVLRHLHQQAHRRCEDEHRGVGLPDLRQPRAGGHARRQGRRRRRHAPREAKDYGFMYSNAFEDLDGHTWVLVYMSGMPPKE